MRTLLLATAAATLLAFNPSAQARNPTCYDPVYDYQTYKEVDGNRKRIHIDVQRPDRGNISQTATYDASGSKTPSGQIEYTWQATTGGLTYSATDTAAITVTPDPNASGGINAYTRLTVRDPVCGFAESTEFNVNYSAN